MATSGSQIRKIEDPLLEVTNLSVMYSTREGELPAIRHVDLFVARGDTFGIVGESGCGKSTLAFALMGYLGRNGSIAEGQIVFDGEELIGKRERKMQQIRGKKLGMVYQEPFLALNPSMKIVRQIAEVLETHRHLSSKEAQYQAIGMLRKLQISDPQLVANNYPHQLSGGMRQRVCIAMAVVTQPLLLIMDEPTTSLDVTVESEILDMVNDIKNRFRTTIIYITHDLSVIRKVSDRVGVMYVGQFVEEGPVSGVIGGALHPYTRGLLQAVPRLSVGAKKMKLYHIPGVVPDLVNSPSGCKFNPRCPYAVARCRVSEPEFKEVKPRHYVRCHEVETVIRDVMTDTHKQETREEVHLIKKSNGLVLSVRGIKTYFTSRTFGFSRRGSNETVKAVDGASFAIKYGQILGVVGESGCGKTTLARTIVGLEKMTEGRIVFEGKDISEPFRGRDKKTLQQIGIVFQDPNTTLNPKRTVKQAIMRPLMLGGASYREALDGAREALIAVGLGPQYMTRYSDQLSGGQKQRVAIARAFVTRPKLVVLDEPTSSLDVSVQASIIELLLNLRNDLDVSYIFISHDLSVIAYISDYIAVMYLGKFVEMGTGIDVLNPPYHPYTEVLFSSVPTLNQNIVQRRIRLKGTIPSPRHVPSGCRFHGRCFRRIGEVCDTKEPSQQRNGDHIIACHIPMEKLAEMEPIVYNVVNSDTK